MAWPATVPTFTTGETPPASKFNDFGDALRAISDPWISYTPTWDAVTSSPSLGNGSIAGAYVAAGKLVLGFRIVLTIGSTTSMGSGAFKFSVPLVMSSAYPLHSPLGVGTLLDASTGTVYSRRAVSFSQVNLVLRDENGTTAMNGTTPVTIATGDRIILTGMSYEAA